MRGIDLTGQVFGRLTVVEQAESRGDRGQYAYWLCECTCGKRKEIRVYSLLNGASQSCGCLAREATTTHGMAGKYKQHRAYCSWYCMKNRCNLPDREGNQEYHGRGIVYDPKWDTFEGFWEDMGGTWKEGLSLDRVNTDGNYCKDNCRWATPKQQSNNRRNTRRLTYQGKTLSVSEWSELTGISLNTLQSRAKLGWSDEDVLTKPVRNQKVFLI